MSRNPVAEPVHTLLAERHSPYAIDPARAVSSEDLRALFEAARWAASSYNAQPWRYIVAAKSRQPELWQQIHNVLAEGNQPWTANAPVLALGLVRADFEHNGKPNKAAAHDLGAASAQLTLEATARGLVVHQMIGLDPDAAREAFAIPAELEAFTALAIGYRGDASVIPEAYAKRDAAPRQRKPLSEIIFAGTL